MTATDGQRQGYSAVFWQTVRWLWELDAVSDVRLCADVGIDRKSLRKRRDAEGWQRGPRPERIDAAYRHGLSRAAAFKTGEWASFDELEAAAGQRSISDFLAARGFEHAMAARNG